jgi:hypothetical protein
MEARWLTKEEMEELRHLGVHTPLEGTRLSRVHDAALFDPDPDPDFRVAERNRHNYRTRRGRICEYPGCEAKVRYTNDVPICGAHEKTEFAECHPAAEPGSAIYPRLFGLRAARKRRGMRASEVALICGRSVKWAEQTERCRNGVPHEIRRLLAEVLNVSEAELLEGDQHA